MLSEEELDKTTKLQKQLLALPRDLSHRAVRHALEAIGELLGSKRAMGSYFFDDSLHVIEHNIGPEVGLLLQGGFRGIDEDGYFLHDDPGLEAVNRMRRASGSGVTHERHLIDRTELEKLDFYRNAFVPARMTHVIGMHARVPAGEAVFAFSFDGDDDPAFNDPISEKRLQLLLPSFEEAFKRLYERSRTMQRTRSSINELPFPAAIADLAGRVVEFNAAAQGQMTHGELINAEWLEKARRVPGPLLKDGRASRLYFQPNEELQPEHLIEKGLGLGLTQRQAEVASLIAQGLTDRQIASELEISFHTARRHCEAVLDKLQISSRSGVFLAMAT